MNERIKELFNKASVYAYEQNPGENSYGRPVDENKYEEDRYTKFAELFVRECAKISLECGINLNREDFRQGIARNIKEHFGVEE